MLRIVRSAAASLVVAAAFLPAAASAQTYSTLPPQNYSQTVFFFAVGAANWAASSFVYTDPTPGSLTSIDVAFDEIYYPGFTNSLDITFLSGTSIQTAAPLETWTVNALPPSGAAVYSFASAVNPTLVTNQTYWVELSTVGYGWDWYAGNPGIINATSAQSSDGGATWNNVVGTPPAFDANWTAAGSPLDVVPEPATMTLMALGLVGMTAAARRRKRNS